MGAADGLSVGSLSPQHVVDADSDRTTHGLQAVSETTIPEAETMTTEAESPIDGDPDASSNPSSSIVLVVVAGVTLCAAMLAALVCCRVRHDRRLQRSGDGDAKQQLGSGDSVGMIANPVFDTLHTMPSGHTNMSQGSSAITTTDAPVYYSVPLTMGDTSDYSTYEEPVVGRQNSPQYSVFNDKLSERTGNDGVAANASTINRYTVFNDAPEIDTATRLYCVPSTADTPSDSQRVGAFMSVLSLEGSTTVSTSTDAAEHTDPLPVLSGSHAKYAVMNDIGARAAVMQHFGNEYAYGIVPTSSTDTHISTGAEVIGNDT